MEENNGKQNQNVSDTKKYQNHVPFSYGNKVACVNDQFSKLFKLGKDSVYKFIIRVVKESIYCSRVRKKHVNKKLVMSKKDDENLKGPTE